MSFAEYPAFDRLLRHAERAIALLDRCRPLNWTSELDRLGAAWEGGGTPSPEFRYSPPPLLGPLLTALEGLERVASRHSPVGALYAGRARELCLEGRLVEAIGTLDFPLRARERFPADGSAHGAAADTVADGWALLEPAVGADRIRSDDERDPQSLLAQLRRLVGEERLPVRVEVSRDLASAAATADGVITVRAGVSHAPASALAIAHHEVYGHALPRSVAAREPLGLFKVGTERCAEDEEGRALLIEERGDLLGTERRRDLGRRHLGARAVRAGADWVETVRTLLERGAMPRDAVQIAARSFRGGGLAREIIYLPALSRVREALASEPVLEGWLVRGRISLEAARILAPSHSNVATTGV